MKKVKKRLLQLLLVTSGYKKVHECLSEIDQAFDILLKKQKKDIIKKIGTFTPTCGYECKEEKGFQKGIIAEQNLIKSKLEKL